MNNKEGVNVVRRVLRLQLVVGWYKGERQVRQAQQLSPVWVTLAVATGFRAEQPTVVVAATAFFLNPRDMVSTNRSVSSSWQG